MSKNQLNLPATPLQTISESARSLHKTAESAQSGASLRKTADPDPARKISESDDQVIASASFLFDKALIDAGITTAEAAHLMGVSESAVHKMRSPNYRECVSLVQLLRCGPSVVWNFHRALHAKQKFGQRALREAMQALSLVAVGIE